MAFGGLPIDWAAGALVAVFLLLVIRTLLGARERPAATGIEALTGRTGVAATDLTPRGTVLVSAETWRAVSDGGRVPTGGAIEVIGVEGITLHVLPAGARLVGRRAG